MIGCIGCISAIRVKVHEIELRIGWQPVERKARLARRACGVGAARQYVQTDVPLAVIHAKRGIVKARRKLETKCTCVFTLKLPMGPTVPCGRVAQHGATPKKKSKHH